MSAILVPMLLEMFPIPAKAAAALSGGAAEAGKVPGFAEILMAAGIVTTTRKTRGDDIDAACGQLAGDVKDRTRAVERMAKNRVILLTQAL